MKKWIFIILILALAWSQDDLDDLFEEDDDIQIRAWGQPAPKAPKPEPEKPQEHSDYMKWWDKGNLS